MNTLIRFCIAGIVLCLLGAAWLQLSKPGDGIGSIVIVMCVLVFAGIAIFFDRTPPPAVDADQPPPDDSHSIPSTTREPTSPQTAAGAILISAGIAGGFFVLTNYDIGVNGYANIARMNERMILLGAAAFAILIGVLVIGFGQMKKR